MKMNAEMSTKNDKERYLEEQKQRHKSIIQRIKVSNDLQYCIGTSEARPDPDFCRLLKTVSFHLTLN